MNLIEALQLSNVELNENGYSAEMKLGEFHAQPFGCVNGGAILAFAEITAGQASNILGKDTFYAVGQSVSGNHMKAAKAKNFLYAKAELVHRGKNSHVWSIRIEDNENRLISIITVTNAILYK